MLTAMPLPTRYAPLARWGLVGAVVLIGVVLLGTVSASYVGVRGASRTLTAGEALALHGELRARLQELGHRPDAAELAALVDELADDGLRFVAILGPGGEIVARAGRSSLDDTRLMAEARSAQPNVPLEDGDRVRVLLRAGPRRPVARAMAPGFGHRRMAGAMLLELEPLEARGLRATATRTLAAGAGAGAALLLIAVLLARWWQRESRRERERERERHLAGLGQLSAVLAHEIRNPLASLKGNAQLLAGALPDGEPARAKAERVVREAIRLETLTNDLLEFARSAELRREDVDPAALLRDAVAEIGGEGKTLELDAGRAPARWPLDAARITRVLTNLIDNAVKAGAPVRVMAEKAGDRLVFTVSDSGPGVAADDAARVFEPFFTRRTHGTGLGLAVAKRIVDLHGGTITLDSVAPQGAVFRVSIPRG